ncbi:MAG: Fur family transcriptional regulator [bacterium]
MQKPASKQESAANGGDAPILALPDVQERIDGFPRLCRSTGLKVTPQRVAIFNMVVSTDSHPTPEDVYSEIRRSTPSISLATVYKILDLFREKGFIYKVSTPGQVTRYDGRVASHHHAICNACGKIQDVFADSVSALPVSPPGKADFQVTDYEIQFRGLCGDCAA